ncbi:hypothetical protein KXR53_33740 [Inquilinus limosus]|uniref:phospholipase D-like domain-containing protein n=1 Tax=Inquilinus limosus TaxID=171674 RepID=UPI003F141BA3
MVGIGQARAYCNNEVAYIAWTLTGKIPDCLGFEVTRVYLNPDDTPARRPDGSEDRVKTAAYVAFKGQRNPDWNVQDTGVWPVQKLTWRDLTLRKRRDGMKRRPEDVRVRYEIRPVGDLRPGMEPVPSNGREKVKDPATGKLKPAYKGGPRPLGYLAPATLTNSIFVTSRLDLFRLTFTNGILAAQWLRNVLMEDGVIKKGELIEKLSDPQDPHRKYLAGDVLPLLRELFARPGSFRLCLYELEDEELEQLILNNGPRCRLILANTGKSKAPGVGWDERNSKARERLRQAGVDVQARMFNNNIHIGHNKFVVHLSPGGTPKAVFTGSTNWTATGVAGQTNNALLIEDHKVAKIFHDYWDRIHADELPEPRPLSADMAGNRQGAQLRLDNAASKTVTLANGASLTTWFSPNMKQRKKPSPNPPLPPDLEHVYRLMRLAKQAIFFLAFYPGQRGRDCIIGEATEIGRKDGKLLVMGAVSSPQAMPNYIPASADDDNEEVAAAKSPSTFREKNVSIVRAARIEDEGIVGDPGKEVLSAGRAIIHDKIVVIDPLSTDCSVILGSHNLGFKASYSNDENMVIVSGDRALAEAYMVHVLDVYDHYRFRAVEQELEREGKKGWSGFLQITDAWQDWHVAHTTGGLAGYLSG